MRGHLQVVGEETVDVGALLTAVARREPRAVGQLFDRLQGAVNRLVWHMLGADAAHDEVINTVFETVVNRVGELRDPRALESWVRAITVNAVRMELRRRRWRRLFTRSLDDQDVLAHPDLSVPDEAQRERLRGLYRALGTLAVDERNVLVLRHLEGLELNEVAAAMKLSLATVKRRLVRAEARLAARLEGSR